MSALFEGGHAVCVEDHLVADVVIALLVSLSSAALARIGVVGPGA